VPFLFVSGDDTLLKSLPAGTTGVLTKHSRSAILAESLPLAIVEDALVRASLEAPRPAAALPDGPLRLYVKCSSFDVPELPFLERESDFTVIVRGDSTRERYSNALAAVEVVASATEELLAGRASDEGFVAQVERVLSAPWPSLKRG
jgi:hypothetical protein